MAGKVPRYTRSVLLLAVLLAASYFQKGNGDYMTAEVINWRLSDNRDKPCEEIYAVREGETLHSISEKCGDPFIIEENPHINDPDDVFPGLLLKVTPFRNR
uniref:LysM domain-containing protein n=1 Tax=Opuntia streptacantha TaxID=393608 RepID=A0A7C9D375_OPUST